MFKHALGVQLYTVRNTIGQAEDETLKRIAEIGYTELETTGRDDLSRISPMLAKYKLKAVSTHLDPTLVHGSGNPDLAKPIATAKQYGVPYLVFPYLMPNDRGDADVYKKLSDKLNSAGEQCHSAGITFCYHNHAFEFGGAAGQRAIDVFDQHLDKKLVNFEVDVFWVSVAGNDPVQILNKYKGRVPLVHLKDKLTGAPVKFEESVPKETFKEVGSGSLDFHAILKAAEANGAKHYFVEQDQTPGDPIDSLAKSYQYLRSL